MIGMIIEKTTISVLTKGKGEENSNAISNIHSHNKEGDNETKERTVNSLFPMCILFLLSSPEFL